MAEKDRSVPAAPPGGLAIVVTVAFTTAFVWIVGYWTDINRQQMQQTLRKQCLTFDPRMARFGILRTIDGTQDCRTPDNRRPKMLGGTHSSS